MLSYQLVYYGMSCFLILWASIAKLGGSSLQHSCEHQSLKKNHSLSGQLYVFACRCSVVAAGNDQQVAQINAWH
jgi:hypothetical protein